MEKFVLDSPTLEEAVKLRSTTNYPPRRPGRSSLKEVSFQGGYDGYFAVQFDGETFSVVDGGAPESGTAGYCWVNGEARTVASAKNIKPKNGFLSIKATHNSEKCSFEIVDKFPSKPESIEKPDYYPIAAIEQRSSQWTFRQIIKWEIPQLWIFADCEDESES
jgi:hypothetical protein